MSIDKIISPRAHLNVAPSASMGSPHLGQYIFKSLRARGGYPSLNASSPKATGLAQCFHSVMNAGEKSLVHAHEI